MSSGERARMEVLAPGGSLDAVQVALAQGADAIYLGVGTAHARVKADNLAPPALPGLVDWLHARGVKAYVALNVPVTTANEYAVAEALAVAHWAGVDALIVRDPRVVEVALRYAPGLPLHASTQVGVSSPATARRVRDAGCVRAVLARECAADEIAAIRAAVPELELEAFVFGALCFGFSGRCLLGHAVAGRSGNYGACAQVCRMPLTDAAGRAMGAAFSLKDVDLTGHLADLDALGVRALKIEGRLKPAAWVGCVTHFVRRAVERTPPRLLPDERLAFDRDVSVIFSRPRTAAWFEGRHDAAALTAPDAPGHQGLRLEGWELRGQGRARRVRFTAPVDVSVRDGLLLSVERGSGLARVPMAITDLRDGRGRRAPFVSAGQACEVGLDAPGRMVEVALHAAARVRARWEKVAQGVPGAVREGRASDAHLVAARLTPGGLEAMLVKGRLRHEASLDLATQPASGAGLDAALLRRYLGAEVQADVSPGFYVNPKDLKAARRHLVAAAGHAWDDARAATEAAIRADLAASRDRAYPSDDALLAAGPAALARVTDLPPGPLRSASGVTFAVTEREGWSEVRLVEAP